MPATEAFEQGAPSASSSESGEHAGANCIPDLMKDIGLPFDGPNDVVRTKMQAPFFATYKQRNRVGRTVHVCCLVVVLANNTCIGGCRQTALPNAQESGQTETVEDTQPATIDIDFVKLSESLHDRGVDAVIDDLLASKTNVGNWRLAGLLDSMRTALDQHPDQLWFQLQARTRLAGWEDLQQQLLAARPSEMLVAKTSLLPGPLPGVVRTWKLGKGGVSFLQLSSDGREMYCARGVPGIIVLDPRSARIVRQFQAGGGLLAITPGTADNDYLVVQTGTGPGWRRPISVSDIRTGEKIALLDTLEIHTTRVGHFGEAHLPHAMQTAQSGTHLVFWNGSSFTDRELANPKNVFRFRSRSKPDDVTPCFIEAIAEDRLLSIDAGGYVRVFDYPSGKEVYPPHQLVTSLEGFAVSGDSSRLACSGFPLKGKQRMIVVWDVAKRTEIARFTWPRGNGDRPVQHLSLAFRDNETLVSGDSKGKIYVWHTASAKPVSQVTAHHDTILALCAAPQRGRVFSGDRRGLLKLVDVATTQSPPQPLDAENVPPARPLRSLDDQWEASCVGDEVNIWDPESGELLHQLMIPADLLVRLGLNTMLGGDATTPIGINLEQKAIVVGGLKKIGHWNFETGEIKTIDAEIDGALDDRMPLMGRIEISPDGQHAILRLRRGLAVFDAKTGELKCCITPDCTLFGVPYFLSGGQLALSFRTPREQGVRIFDLASGQEVAQHVHGSYPHCVAYADRAGVFVTAGSRGGIEAPLTARDPRGTEAPVTAGDRRGSEGSMTVGRGRAIQGSVTAGNRRGSEAPVTARDRRGTEAPVPTRAPRGSGATEPYTIAMWKPGKEAEFLSLPDDVGAARVAISPDGNRVITTSSDGVLLLWDASKRTLLRRFDLDVPISSMEFDGTTVVLTEKDKTKQHVFEYIR